MLSRLGFASGVARSFSEVRRKRPTFLLPPQSRMFSEESPDQYLIKLGYENAEIREGMLQVFTKPTVKDLQNFGKSGLSSLHRAVQREIEQKKAEAHLPDVTVYIRSPRDSKTSLPLEVIAKQGKNLYDVHQTNTSLAQMMECACGGIAACSTCHVIFKQEDFDKLAPADEAELDMLDLAEGVTATSRLGCQVPLEPVMQGMILELPIEVKNLF
eukprot:GSChrysophyteH1.ASY1.ANO1.639.1 assembled CDS